VFPKRSLASGDMAIDKLPIPPDLASGEININGTAVLCNLSGAGLSGCAFTEIATKHNATQMVILTEGIRIILKCF
jgi:hypothetical protein